jgi:hypothetical protein
VTTALGQRDLTCQSQLAYDTCMTVEQVEDGFTIECPCGAHPTGNKARVNTACGLALAKLRGKAQLERVHGFVNLAHHPALSRAPQIRANGPWAA